MEDGAFYSQDAASKQQVGQLSPEGLFRVDDLSLSGQIKFPHPWSYEVAGNYKGLDPTSTRSWTLTYAYLSIPLGPIGSVTVGKQKEGVGLEMLENGRDLPFMERSTMTTAFAFVDSHIVGVRFSNSIVGDRMTWSAGWFNNWLDDGLSFDESGNIFAGRVTGLALEQDGGRRLLHLGVSGVYRQSKGQDFKLRSVPEVYEAPDFVDTGSFPATSGTSVGGEIALVEGPVTVSGEYAYTSMDAPQVGNPHFSGYYAMVVVGPHGRTAPVRPFHGGLRSDQPGGAVLVPPRRLRRLGSRGALVEHRPDERRRPGREVRPAERRALLVSDEPGPIRVQLRLRAPRPRRRARAAPTSTSSACSSSCSAGAATAAASEARFRSSRPASSARRRSSSRWPGPTHRRCRGFPGTTSCPRARR